MCVHTTCGGLAPSALDLVQVLCGSGLSLRSEVYYFSAPNIAYFTVYSTTRAHDSLGNLGSLAPLRAQSQGEAPRLRAARCGYLLYTSTTPYHLRPCGVPSHSDE